MELDGRVGLPCAHYESAMVPDAIQRNRGCVGETRTLFRRSNRPLLALELRRNETRRLGLRSGAGTRTRRGGTAPRAPSACQRTGSLRTSSRVRESNPLRRHQKPLANRWPYPECIVRRSGVEPDPYRLRACRTASVLTTRGTPEGRTQSVSGKSRTRSRAPTSRIAFSAFAQVDLLPLPWSAVESNHPP